MIYMVEMALLDTARRTEWDAWYVAHQGRLLSIPGFRASQRFEAIHAAESPFVALHEVDSADIFTGPVYRSQAGPSNTGKWQTRMGNWHRNLFALDHSPEVPPDARLVVVEDAAHSAVPPGASVTWMEAVGLDRSVQRRGLLVLRPPRPISWRGSRASACSGRSGHACAAPAELRRRQPSGSIRRARGLPRRRARHRERIYFSLASTSSVDWTSPKVTRNFPRV